MNRRTLQGLAAIALLYAGPAHAGRYLADEAPGDVVVAQSREGNGTATGPVRAARYGLEVRLPGGTWIGCRRSCAETLRVEALDVFPRDELIGAGTLHRECGIFGCLDIGTRY